MGDAGMAEDDDDEAAADKELEDMIITRCYGPSADKNAVSAADGEGAGAAEGAAGGADGAKGSNNSSGVTDHFDLRQSRQVLVL